MIRIAIAGLLAAFALSAFSATDVNRATRADLESVKGIGPGLSAKIVQARETGMFKDWNDLVQRVGGIGPGNAAKLSGNGLTVGGSTFDAAAVAKPEKAKSAKTEKAEKAEKTEKATAKADAGEAKPKRERSERKADKSASAT
jgi:competence protein ComEA